MQKLVSFCLTSRNPKMNLRFILIPLLPVAKDVSQRLVFLGRGRDGQGRADLLFGFQSPLSDDSVQQLLGLGGEGLNQQVAETTGVDDSDERVVLPASDVFVHRSALPNCIQYLVFFRL